MTPSADPQLALGALAAQLRADETVISPLVVDSPERPALGAFAASGPRARSDPASYALVVEAVREGYLLHYGEPRVVSGADTSLALLAGDYLYALGLERLAAIGDQAAIRELSDLISLSAQIHADGPGPTRLPPWPCGSAATIAIAAGTSDAFEAAKQGLRRGDRNAVEPPATRRRPGSPSDPGLPSSSARSSEAIHFPG